MTLRMKYRIEDSQSDCFCEQRKSEYKAYVMMLTESLVKVSTVLSQLDHLKTLRSQQVHDLSSELLSIQFLLLDEIEQWTAQEMDEVTS